MVKCDCLKPASLIKVFENLTSWNMCNVYDFILHIFIVKLGYTGVITIFLIFYPFVGTR